VNRILVAVHDSPPSLAAAGVAIALAGRLHAALRIVAVGETDDHRGSRSMATHVSALARHAGIEATTHEVVGAPPFEMLLREAQAWGADLIVMGRSDAPRPGAPRVGGTTEHLLEFATVPVLVVPDTRPQTGDGS
jgi:nucleotide-binding universal stress UspA family protein